MNLKQSNGGKTTHDTVVTPFRKTRPNLSLDQLLAPPRGKNVTSPEGNNEQVEPRTTVIFPVAANEVPTAIFGSAKLFELFESDIMDSVFSTGTGSDLYKKHLQAVMKERYGTHWSSTKPDKMDTEVARTRAWTEWKEKCDLFSGWKPGKTVFNMPAMTPEMLAKPDSVVSQEALCETGIIPSAEIDELAELIDKEAFLATPQGKLLFLETLSKYAEIKSDGTNRSMVFTEEQIEEAKSAAWKKYKEKQSIVVTHKTVFQMKAVAVPETPKKVEEPKVVKPKEASAQPKKSWLDSVVDSVLSFFNKA